jgi:hypothetical protein
MKLFVLVSLIGYGGLAQVTTPAADSTSSVKPQEQCVVEGSVVNAVSGVQAATFPPLAQLPIRRGDFP